MLRVIVQKKKAVIFVIVLCLLAALATIWPMRMYREEHAFSSGLDPVMESGIVDGDTDAGEYFIAQYDHLQTMEFYVESVQSSGQADVQVFHVGDNNAMELVAEEVVDLPEETPGFALASIDADMTVGDQYVYTVHAAKETDPGWNIVTGAEFTVGYESTADAGAALSAPLYQLGFYNDSGIEGVALKTKLTYRVALSKGPSAVLGLLFTGIAAAAILAVCLYYRRHPARNSLVTVLHVMQRVLTPVVIAVSGLSFVAVWPLRMFDSRVPDILIYEAGIVLGTLVCLYGLWHDRSREQDLVNTELFHRNIWHYGIILCIALIMNFSADYMNAINDHLHDASMHRIVAMICLIVLFMGDAASNFNAKTACVSVISVILGIIYYNINKVPGSGTEIAQTNAVLRTRAFACVMAAVAVTSVLCMLTDRIRRKKRPLAGIRGWVVFPVVLLAVMLVVFRNTRLWIPLLVGIWLLFYVRYRFWEGRERLLQDLCEGIILDFICKVIYSMLHRYYMAYLYSRFSMHFHTPTVTAYYLCVVAAAAITLFMKRWRETSAEAEPQVQAETSVRHVTGTPQVPQNTKKPGVDEEVQHRNVTKSDAVSSDAVSPAKKSRGRRRLAHIWKEGLLLGFVESYMVMSLSRAGIAVLFALLMIGSFYMGGRGSVRFGVRIRRGVAALGLSLLMGIAVFPIAFTGQRIISTVYHHPQRFEELEPYDDRVLRNVEWNSTRFMNIEIFIRDFGDRIIGGDVGSKLYYDKGWYIPQGYRTASLSEDITAYYVKEGLVASEGNAVAEVGGVESQDAAEYGSIDTGDVSNGRMWLYHVYLQNLNMTGHDSMGVDLGNGEIAMHAHNIILQTAYDCGIPTGVVLAVVLLLLLAASFRFAGHGGGYNEYALAPFLLMAGFCTVGMVEWIFHFSNPYTIAVMFSLAPVLFPEQTGNGKGYKEI